MRLCLRIACAGSLRETRLGFGEDFSQPDVVSELGLRHAARSVAKVRLELAGDAS
jgi:hypothetical protein